MKLNLFHIIVFATIQLHWVANTLYFQIIRILFFTTVYLSPVIHHNDDHTFSYFDCFFSKMLKFIFFYVTWQWYFTLLLTNQTLKIKVSICQCQYFDLFQMFILNNRFVRTIEMCKHMNAAIAIHGEDAFSVV